MKVTCDIIRWEFIGSDLKIIGSRNPEYVGLSGKVVDETKNTFTILHNGARKKIIKEVCLFHFRFSDGTIVEVDGKLLVGRPEDRLKKRIKRLW